LQDRNKKGNEKTGNLNVPVKKETSPKHTTEGNGIGGEGSAGKTPLGGGGGPKLKEWPIVGGEEGQIPGSLFGRSPGKKGREKRGHLRVRSK